MVTIAKEKSASKASKNVFSFVLSIVVSVCLIAWLFSHVEKGALQNLYRNIFWPAFGCYLLFTLIGFALRAWRYQWLLSGVKVSVPNLFLVTMVRQVFVDLLPMKIGELSYVVLLKKRFGIGIETGLSSVMAVFLFDCIAALLLLIVSLIAVGKVALDGSPATVAAAAAGMILVLAVLLRYLDRIVYRMNWLAFLFFKREFSLLHRISDELAGLKRRGIYVKTFLLSFVIRVFKYLTLFSVLYALIRSQGVTLEQLSFFKVVVGVAGAEVSAFLPVQGLAGFGTWEAAWTLSFQWMGFARELAILSGFGVHLATQVTEYVLGALCLVLLWLPLKRRNG